MTGGDSGPAPPLVLLETFGEGHRWRYVSLIARTAADRGRAVTIVTSDPALAEPGFREYGSGLPGLPGIEFHVVPEPTGFAARVATLRRIRGLLGGTEGGRAGRRATLAVPDADYWVPAILATWPQRRDMRLLIMRPALAGQATSMPRKAKWGAARAAAMLSPGTIGALVSPLHPAARTTAGGVRMVPDPPQVPPLIPKQDARRRLGLNGHPTLLVCGGIEPRKSIGHLLEWARHHDGDWRLALAGPVWPESRDMLDEARRAHGEDALRNVIVRDDYLSTEELGAWISAADCIATLHENEGSSGIQLTAAAAGVPVLAGGSQDLKVGLDAGIPGVWVDSREWGEIDKALRLVQESHADRAAVALDRGTQERWFTSFFLDP